MSINERKHFDKNNLCYQLKFLNLCNEMYEIIIEEINYFLSHGEIKVWLDRISGVSSDESRTFELEYTKEGIKYQIGNKKAKKTYNGEFIRKPNGEYFTKYTEKDTVCFNNIYHDKENKRFDIYNITTKQEINYYNVDGYQIYRYNEEKKDNYFLNKKTKVKELCCPNCFENYTEKNYAWKVSRDFIIQRHTVKYIHPIASDSPMPLRNQELYSIGKNVIRDEKELQRGGQYIWFNKEQFNNFMNKKCTVNDIWAEREGDYYKFFRCNYI